jgi:hypothetical protein
LENAFHFPEQDRAESSKAIETILRVLSDFFDDFRRTNPQFDISGNGNVSHTHSGLFTDTFPYFIHMIYVVLLEMQEYRHLTQSPTDSYTTDDGSDMSSSSAFEREIGALRMILQSSTQRWQMSRKYDD